MKIILKKRKKNKRKGERKLIERGGEVERKERERVQNRNRFQCSSLKKDGVIKGMISVKNYSQFCYAFTLILLGYDIKYFQSADS